MNLNIQLYHEYQRVRLHSVMPLGIAECPAYIIKVIRSNTSFKCPHCGRACVAEEPRGVGPFFAYYLDFPHPTSCCNPWGINVLYNNPEMGEHSFHSLLKSLRQEGKQDGY